MFDSKIPQIRVATSNNNDWALMWVICDGSSDILRYVYYMCYMYQFDYWLKSVKGH